MDEVRLATQAREPQMGDVLTFGGDGWEPRSASPRAMAVTHVHTERQVTVAMGPQRSPDFVSGSSGWQILEDGSAEFNDVVVRGTLYATVGEIGGWTINADNITGGNAVLHSGGYLLLGSGDDVVRVDAQNATWRLWVGDATGGDAPFRVSKTGEVWANNITARGEIRTAVLRYDEIHATSGMLLVTPNAGKLKADLTTAASGSFDVGEAGRFTASDVVRSKDGTNDVWLAVTADNGDGTYDYTLSSGSTGVTFEAGAAVVGYGASGEGGVLLDAVAAHAPFVDVFTHAGSPWSSVTTKTRMGNLAGITDADLNPSGYGLYSENVYLKGSLIAGGGEVLIGSEGITIVQGNEVYNRIRFIDNESPPNETGRLAVITGGEMQIHAPKRIDLVCGGCTFFLGASYDYSLMYLAHGFGFGTNAAASDKFAMTNCRFRIDRPETYGISWISVEDAKQSNAFTIVFNDAVGADYMSLQDSGETEVARIDSDGRLRVASGSAAAPALSFLSDTDTGMYRVSSNVLGFAVGGVEYARLSAGQFTVKHPSSHTYFWFNSGSIGEAGMIFQTAGASKWQVAKSSVTNHFFIYDYTLGGVSFRIYPNGNMLLVESGGYVGIGDTLPAYRLELPNTASVAGRGRANQWVTYSDKRSKQSGEKVSDALALIMKLRPVRYKAVDCKKTEDGLEFGEVARDWSYGLVAQELTEVLAEVVYRPEDEARDMWGISYTELIPWLIAAIQELAGRVQ